MKINPKNREIWANAMREKSFEKGSRGIGSSPEAHICLFSRYQIRERPQLLIFGVQFRVSTFTSDANS